MDMYVSRQKAAEMIGVKPATLRNWGRNEALRLPFTFVRGLVHYTSNKFLYKVSDVEMFIEDNKAYLDKVSLSSKRRRETMG